MGRVWRGCSGASCSSLRSLRACTATARRRQAVSAGVMRCCTRDAQLAQLARVCAATRGGRWRAELLPQRARRVPRAATLSTCAAALAAALAHRRSAWPPQAVERGRRSATPGEEPAEDWDTAWVNDAGAAFEVPWFEEDKDGSEKVPCRAACVCGVQAQWCCWPSSPPGPGVARHSAASGCPRRCAALTPRVSLSRAATAGAAASPSGVRSMCREVRARAATLQHSAGFLLHSSCRRAAHL